MSRAECSRTRSGKDLNPALSGFALNLLTVKEPRASHSLYLEDFTGYWFSLWKGLVQDVQYHACPDIQRVKTNNLSELLDFGGTYGLCLYM